MSAPTFDDEFDTLNLSTGPWKPAISWAPNGTTDPTVSSWSVNPAWGPTSARDANVFSDSNGVLSMAIKPAPGDVKPSDVGNKPFLSGQLTTQGSFSQTYGYFEINAKLGAAAGVNSAFWLLPEDGSWPPELDVEEVLGGSPTTLVNTAHSQAGGSHTANPHWSDIPDASVGFHTYGLDWEPDKLPDTVVVRFEWRFTDAGQADALCRLGDGTATAVDHTLRLRLRPGGHGQVYSTDTAAWPVDDGAEPPFRRQPFAVLGEDRLPAARKATVSVRRDAQSGVLVLDEQVDVLGILLSDIWGFAEFEAECLHEVGQTTAFDPASSGTLAHRANACVEMPAEVLVRAVRLARDIPYGPDTPYAGSMAACERHPALLALCGWWNRNAPDPRHRRAGLCSVELRVRDDGEYWNAYHETPNMPVDTRVKIPEIAARVGDVVLVAFHQGQHAATFPGAGGCALHDVAGNPWQTVGVTEAEVRCGEADEGWYVLSGLAALPDRFPAAWDWLTGNALRGRGQPADGASAERRAMAAPSGRRPTRDPAARAGLSRMLARLRARMTRTRA